jgi:hypothetical protein
MSKNPDSIIQKWRYMRQERSLVRRIPVVIMRSLWGIISIEDIAERQCNLCMQNIFKETRKSREVASWQQALKL